MTNDPLKDLPFRRGHFLLESGYHADQWFGLDALFVSPREIAPLVTELASRLRPHGASALCGPLLGGAFLAQALATELGTDFLYSESAGRRSTTSLFTAEYHLPAAVRQRARGARVALVDDVISAGSSIRATAAALKAAGATTVVVGSLLFLGRTALDYLARFGVPVETLGQQEFAMWEPAACPLCRTGTLLEDSSDLRAGGG